MKASSATFFSKFALSPSTCLSKQVTLPAYSRVGKAWALVKTAPVTKGHLGAHLGFADTPSSLSADFCVHRGHSLQQVLVVYIHLLEFLSIQRTFSSLVTLLCERGCAGSSGRLLSLFSALPHSLALRDTQVHLRVPLGQSLSKKPRLRPLENSLRNQDLGAGCACRPGGSPQALRGAAWEPMSPGSASAPALELRFLWNPIRSTGSLLGLLL